MTALTSRGGDAYSPSSTNRPIWASQPVPSANERTPPRWGRSELPRTSAATYVARSPEACVNWPAVKPSRQTAIAASG